MPEQDQKYLKLLAQQFPNKQAVFTEIINLQAILNLPKGTEHFMSDVHGEYEAFMHIQNNCSGVIKEHVELVLGKLLNPVEQAELCTLIYYPTEKLARVRDEQLDSPAWYRQSLDALITLARSLSSRYTRSKVRKAIPHEFTYIIDELLHTHPDEHDYRVQYHDRIIESILETGATDDFICSFAELIKRLAVDHLHLVGDIYDRGNGAARIMDALATRPGNLDIQWGNHDILWIGAAAGEAACILSVLRNNLKYHNYSILENDYGISLRHLMSFADCTYRSGERITPLMKAITVMLFKLEGQIIQRHPEWNMHNRMLLDKIDETRTTVTLSDKSTWPLISSDFPTIDLENPYELNKSEQSVVDKLVAEFQSGDHLQRHITHLLTHGSLYLVHNNNLLFHGCIPMNSDGTFSSMLCEDVMRSGRDYLDFCDDIIRRAYRVRDRVALDWIWYLWIGYKSPASGRLVKTFERSFIEDSSTWVEPMDSYFELTQHTWACDAIMKEFGVDAENGHIINGHTPVKTLTGESPIRAQGKLLVIDGGFCRSYHPKTGIAGYTLIYSSRGMRLKAHEAFKSVRAALDTNADIQSDTDFFAPVHARIMVSDTDTGVHIRSQIADLKRLLQAYRLGHISES
ncbi:fructose-1,6-bisphosphatase [Collinsella sp. zg1085]|uniref:fructose-1,6-bisphosphatase n=1 Tax=Collinsella sp. zg1085 TaxID=2844380 RepID=UPI001C0D40EE|nr:fructose-1,6-bisphosphatase [Collinsella sp. zg1085]QWT18275.1 fructose-1,6-bisphosphatase [Collinsella sp. zg1085]